MAIPAKSMTSLMAKMISWVSTGSMVAAPSVLLTLEMKGDPPPHIVLCAPGTRVVLPGRAPVGHTTVIG